MTSSDDTAPPTPPADKEGGAATSPDMKPVEETIEADNTKESPKGSRRLWPAALGVLAVLLVLLALWKMQSGDETLSDTAAQPETQNATPQDADAAALPSYAETEPSPAVAATAYDDTAQDTAALDDIRQRLQELENQLQAQADSASVTSNPALARALGNTQRAFRELIPVVTDTVRSRVHGGRSYDRAATSLITLLQLTGQPLTSEQQQLLRSDSRGGLPSLKALRSEIDALERASQSTDAAGTSPKDEGLAGEIKQAMGKMVIIRRKNDNGDSGEDTALPSGDIASTLTADTIEQAPAMLETLPDAFRQQPGFEDWAAMVRRHAALDALLTAIDKGDAASNAPATGQ